MAEMGRPVSQNNPYNGIALNRNAVRANETNASSRMKNIGEQLNQLAGIKKENGFVDGKNHNKLDKDAFLKLLSAQLQNQNPLDPVDQKKFAAELAQFSQLEQVTNMNNKLDNLGINAPAQNKFFGASFIGKEVMTHDSTINYDGNGPVTLPFYLPRDARNLVLRVFDSRNQMVAQLEKENLSSGPQRMIWEGVNLDGTPATKDSYRFEVRAFDNSYTEFKGETQAQGLVTGVEFDGNETVLIVDNSKRVFLRDVDSFKSPKQKEINTIDAHGQKHPSNSMGLMQEALNTYNKN